MMANTSIIWQQAAHTTNCYLLAAQQEPYKNVKLLVKNVGEFSGGGGGGQENGHTNNKTERARGLGRKTRKETGKGNKTAALRFQTGR